MPDIGSNEIARAYVGKNILKVLLQNYLILLHISTQIYNKGMSLPDEPIIGSDHVLVNRCSDDHYFFSDCH